MVFIQSTALAFYIKRSRLVLVLVLNRRLNVGSGSELQAYIADAYTVLT